jgi:DHA1 family multidrug resistance protein-like MFS transporter
MQLFVIHRVVKKLGEKKAFIVSLFVAAASYLCLFFVRSIEFYILIALFSSAANSFFLPLIQTILSKEADEKSQGSILGLNASYVSIGNILGPIIAGILSTAFLPLPFLIGSFLILVCFILAFGIKTAKSTQQHAF